MVTYGLTTVVARSFVNVEGNTPIASSALKYGTYGLAKWALEQLVAQARAEEESGRKWC
jgi:hypothetical protein